MADGPPQALYGTAVEEVRWRECVSYVNSNMESAVGSLYVREAFPGDSKDAVGALLLDCSGAPVHGPWPRARCFLPAGTLAHSGWGPRSHAYTPHGDS